MVLLFSNDSYEVTGMNIKGYILSISTLALISCSVNNETANGGFKYNENRTSNLGMADSRNVNLSMIDNRLQDLIAEASLIETEMGALWQRLSDIQNVINDYSATEVASIQTSAGNNAQEIILPVPERPSKEDGFDKIVEKELAVPPTILKEQASKSITNIKNNNLIPSNKGVYKVRYGVHKDKTRLVFDVNGSKKNEMNFDKDAGVVTIKMPDTSWTTSISEMYKLNQVSGYEAKPTEQGTIIALAVKNTSDVKVTSLSRPDRLVVDIIK